MNKGYKGGCFSLKVPPVFCSNGAFLLIPKGRYNEVYVYDTLGNGEPRSQFSASKEIITGLGQIKIDHNEELLITATIGGLIRIFALNDILDHKDKPLVEFRVQQSIFDLKIAKNNIYFIAGEFNKEENAPANHNISLYKIARSDILSRISSNNNKNDSKFPQKFLKKIIDFSYGALNFQVSMDESIFCFIWKNILLIWNVDYPDKIIRFRHSEYILSIIISENNQFLATGDAYGRLTYWFIPPSSSKEGIQMWKNAPCIHENSDFEKMIYKYNVKTSISHWHSHELTCLNIIPGTDVILSGGEEAVLVLWRQTFSSDSYLIHTRNQYKNPNNNGTRQFIPRLGAPIYNITPFKKDKVSKEIQNTHNNHLLTRSDTIPSLLAAIVCSDNSIKIIDLVHNKIINSIYGISTPFNFIKAYSNDSPQIKIIDSHLFNPTRLLVSIISHPFKLHIHDLIRDNCYSTLLCKPEETYSSKVGDGLSSSKLVKEDITRITLVDAYYSRNSKFALTIESQKFDHFKDYKRTYNLKFWKINLSNETTHFELVSKYPIAHIDQVISIEETKSFDDIYQQQENTCFITTSSKCEIKCWVYKSQIKEWVNSSIIHGQSEIEVYSTCFSEAFNKLFLASSKGIIIYNWNCQHSILLESDIGHLSVKSTCQITQMVIIMYSNEYYLLGLSPSSRKLYVWNITRMELALEQDLDLNSDSKLVHFQRCGVLFNQFNQEIPFQFAIIKTSTNQGIVSLYKFDKHKKSRSNKNSQDEIKLKFLKDIEIELIDGESMIKDAIIQYKVEDMKICIYLVLLLSTCDVYIQQVGVLDRSEIVSEILQSIKNQAENNERDSSSIKDYTDKSLDKHHSADDIESSEITNIQESIEKMFLKADKGDKQAFTSSTLLNVSKTVQSIISYSNDPLKRDVGINQSLSSFSTLYCLNESNKEFSMTFSKKSLNQLSQNLNTCICPSPSSLFWSFVNNSKSLNDLSLNNKTSSDVKVFNFKKSNSLNESNSPSTRSISDHLKGEIIISGSLKPLQTQKLESILKKATFNERKVI